VSTDLTAAEVAKATGKTRAASQAAVLARRGVPFVFTGSAVRLVREVAAAFGLIKQREPWRLVVRSEKPEPSQEDQHAAWLWLFFALSEVHRCRASTAARHAAERLAAKRAIAAKRRAAERSQTPAWADQEAIRAIYAEALRLTDETGVVHHVDHGYPLRGALVSGLHVHQNLKAVPALDNMKKGNRFTP
jgi:hypothetical protein